MTWSPWSKQSPAWICYATMMCEFGDVPWALEKVHQLRSSSLGGDANPSGSSAKLEISKVFLSDGLTPVVSKTTRSR